VGALSLAEAINFELSHDLTGYHCQYMSQKVMGGTMITWKCRAAVIMIDRDAGTLYSCGAAFSVQLLNGVYYGPAQPPPLNGSCAEAMLGFITVTADKFSWQLLPAGDIVPVDPTMSQPIIKPMYWWQTSADQIQVCLQVPIYTGHFPNASIFWRGHVPTTRSNN
jgi:hypothetical protein